MKRKHVLIVSPGILPVPAVNGGAVESLIENFAIENEVHRQVRLTIVSVWNPKAYRKSVRFRETDFIFIRMPLYKKAGDFGVYTYMDRVKKDWRCMFYRHHYREKYYMEQIAGILQKHNYDLVIFENCMSLMGALRMGDNLARYAGKYDYHMHAAVLDVDSNQDLLIGCRRIMAVSDYVRNDILRAYKGTREEQVTTVRNGVSFRRFGKEREEGTRERIRRKLGVEGKTVFLYSGRLSPEKGVLELIRGFKAALPMRTEGQKEPILLICGTPFFGEWMKNSYYSGLRAEAAMYREEIRFIGFVPYERMPDLYQAADVVILPSTAPDAAPLVLLEGMMGSAAVAASDVGGIPEYAGEKGALLFPPGDEEKMRDTIALLFDEEIRKRVSKAGRKRGRQFNLKNYYFDMLRAMQGKKKIALLGTGERAYDALLHFGRGITGCFVKFDPQMREKELFGIPVIGKEEFLEKAEVYTPVIISSHCGMIAEMLRQKKIQDCGYFSPVYRWLLDEIKKREYEKIVLFGGGMAELFLSDLKNECKKDAVCVTDVKDQEDILCHADLILVTDPDRHSLLAQRAMKKKLSAADVIDLFQPRLQFDTERILIDPYRTIPVNRSEENRIRHVASPEKRREINEFVKDVGTEPAMFSVIEIETVNRCNGTCSFCPVNRRNDTRKMHVMNDELFEKIIRELSMIGYKGHVTLYSNNEPLLDPNLSERAAFSRKMLPDAVIHVFTNGTLLTLERFLELIPHVDEFVIDNYSVEHRLHETVQTVYEFVREHSELRRKVTVVVRDPEEILSTRGGDAPNRKYMPSFPENGCALPFQQMVVRPDGKLSLCCNDPLGKETLGDLSKQTLLEAWNSEAYRKVRKELMEGRGKRKHCRYCDVFDIY